MKKLSRLDQVYSKIVFEQSNSYGKVGNPIGERYISNGKDVNVKIEDDEVYSVVINDLYGGFDVLVRCRVDNGNNCLRAEKGSRIIFFDGFDKDDRDAVRHRDILAIMPKSEFEYLLRSAIANKED